MEYHAKQHIAMCNELIEKLEHEHILTFDEYLYLIENREVCKDFLFEKASSQRDKIYGKEIYVRGLIEFSNYCKNNCYYCGIRKDNSNLERYRLSKEEILECCEYGYSLGLRTFVLQSGEDKFFTDEILCNIVSQIKKSHNDVAVTLSIGERSFDSYKLLKEAGTDRFLLRHETCNKEHYQKLHPAEMSFDNRINCLKDLKNLGYQVGAGFMVGSPCQTNKDLASELIFLKELNPEMCGIGPFILHKDTPFKNEKSGTVELTLFMLGLVRLTLPNVLLPATTALGTLDEFGREKGIKAGANVLMPNLSPLSVRKKYMLYDNKICTGEESASCIESLKNRIRKIGYEIVVARGDYKGGNYV